ncbi:hypothetical protein TL16_g06821 [Triparma laevis f. inornata]|uniref:START domain-containing protein n=1 Tax=Triparma laevis f. inornata TaxID=1714386 RepID=A0A9W7AME4_9STRA|nr:hypothetical protein TL16_g06821 [Triparma laevis f. inornata]
MTFEVYVKYNSFNRFSRVFDFGNGADEDNVLLCNFDESSSTEFWVGRGSDHKYLKSSNFDSSTWTHLILTVYGSTMKTYKNGALAGTKDDGQQPNSATRTNHWIGRSNWPDDNDGYFDGTISYIKMWHGVALQQSDVTELYAPHNTAHHFWDFRGDCSEGSPVTDTITGDLDATPKNGATCSENGIDLDGESEYVDVGAWEWGGTTSIEVYVKYNSFNRWSRVLDFSNDGGNNDVVLVNHQTTSSIGWSVFQESTPKELITSNWDSSTWTHVVVTVSGTDMKVYKNGIVAGTKTDGVEPNVMTRTGHYIGAGPNWASYPGYFDGTIAYVKVWHGVELQQSDVTELYAPRNTAHHFWDFRGCTTDSVVTDSITGDLGTTLTGPTCSADGLSLDGTDDYANIDGWEWGGTTSIEMYVKSDSFNYWSMVFDFGNGQDDDDVSFRNVGTTSTMCWEVYQGSTPKWFTMSNFDSSTWTHIVATVSGTNMKVYKNGVFAGGKTDGWEPNVMTRSYHDIGAYKGGSAYFFDGTIAYIKMWHGIELQQSDVTDIYAPYNIAHHFWDFRGCTTGSSVTDSIAGDLVATPMNGDLHAVGLNGPQCFADGITLDGIDDYVEIDNWEWGDTTTIEAYVKYDSFNKYSRVLDFSNGEASNNVMLMNHNIDSTIVWEVRKGETSNHLEGSSFEKFDPFTWTHVVVTVSGTNMNMYKNGELVGYKDDGSDPTVLTRSQHWLGRSAWQWDGHFQGTFGYVKIWHNVELSETDVTDIYTTREATLCSADDPRPDGTCTTCEAGKYASSSSVFPQCIPCVPGRYSSTTSEASEATCLACDAGTASSVTGATSASNCANCVAGKYSSAEASASCTDCRVGRYSTSSPASSPDFCLECGAGKASSTPGAPAASYCDICDTGTYSAAGSDTCSEWKGQYSDEEGLAACKVSPAGFKPNEAHTAKSVCPKGRYSPANADSCTPCTSKGTYSDDEGLTACKVASAGYKPKEDRTGVDKCEAATFSEGGLDSCTPCRGQGQYSDEEGSTTCKYAPAGFKPNVERNDTTKCEAGTYSFGLASVCTPCENGKFPSSDATHCEKCPQYQEFDEAKGKCVCMATFTTLIGLGDDGCTCEPGKTLVGGNCTACEDGRYKDLHGVGSCEVCDSSYIKGAFFSYPDSLKTDQESCACGIGSFREQKMNAKEGELKWYCQDCEDHEEDLQKEMIKCNVIGLKIDELPLQKGFWRSGTNAHAIEGCDNDESCSGYNKTTNCAIGHRGPLCSVCEGDYAKNALGICKKCASFQLSPFVEAEENYIAEASTISIFFTVLAAIMIELNTNFLTMEPNSHAFGIILIIVQSSIFVFVFVGVLIAPAMNLFSKFKRIHEHDCELKGLDDFAGGSKTPKEKDELFFEYFKELAESDEAKAGWMKLEAKNWDAKKHTDWDGKKHTEQLKEWLKETGAVGEWRCSTGDGPIDQTRVVYTVKCDLDTIMERVNSIKEDHASSVGNFTYIINKSSREEEARGEYWRQKYRAIKLPWPMRQRDIVYTEHQKKRDERRDKSGKIIVKKAIWVFMRSSKDLDGATKELSSNLGRVRAEMKLAGYKVEFVDDNTTKMTFLMSIDLGGPFAEIDYINRQLAGRYMKGIVDMHIRHVEKEKKKLATKARKVLGNISDPPPPLPLVSRAVAKLGEKRSSLVTSPIFAGMRNTDSTIEDTLNIEMGRMIKKTAGVVVNEEGNDDVMKVGMSTRSIMVNQTEQKII